MIRYKISNAVIQQALANYPVWIVECPNPETLLCNWLKIFFAEMRFAELFPNFGGIRISNVHPFAMLLFQDVMGTKPDLSVFPSITVNDTSETEDFVDIGRGYEEMIIDQQYMAEVHGYVAQNKLMVAPTALAFLDAAVAIAPVSAVKADYRGTHQIDLNIWTDNKTINGYIYDMIKDFINSRRGLLHSNGISIVGNLTGRRSGDISVEWGKLLFGSNLTVPCVIEAGALRAELPSTIINSVEVDATYYAGQYTLQFVPPSI